MTTRPVSPDPRRWWALALLCTAAFMVILDASIVLVAVPSIEQDLQLGAGAVQWVLSAYALTFGGLLLLGGRTADLLGRRRVFLAGVALFVASSLLCGLAWNGDTLVAARAVQGISAALMTPAALAIVMTTFTEGAERNRALGFWGATGGLGGTAGAVVGGPLTDGPGWQWIFFLNIPVGIVLLALAPVLLHESRADTRGRTFDLAGAVTVTAAISLVVYAVVQVPHTGWSGRTPVLLVVAAALFAAFVRIERRSVAPLVPLRIFRSRLLVGGNLVTLTIGMAVFGMNFALTQYGQLVLGYSAIQFGLMSSVLAATAVAGSMLGQSLVTRTGFRPVALAGLGIVGLACLVLTRVSADGSYLGDIVLGLLIFGPGLGAGTVAGSIAALTGIAEADSGVASGVQNASFQIGGALGIAVLAGVAMTRTAEVGGDPAAALTAGYSLAFGVAAAFAAAGLLAAWFLLRPVPRSEPVKV